MKTYKCRKIIEDIKINGDISKKVWQQAQETTLVDTVTGDNARQKTSVWALWSDNYLYIAFQCADNFMNASMTEYNDLLYNEEVVEVFICCNNNKMNYTEIEINPLNSVLHYFVFNNLKGDNKSFARVNKVIESAVMKQDEEKIWSVEVKIPIAELILGENNHPKQGCEWKVNFYRIDRPEDGKDEYSAWSPTGIVNYHMPQCFGTMIFVE